MLQLEIFTFGFQSGMFLVLSNNDLLVLIGFRIQIYNLQDIDDNLALLPLKHISFQDIHFGACPVTKEIKFRQNLIKKLPQVRLFLIN